MRGNGSKVWLRLRQTREITKLADSGVPAQKRFAFYDQAGPTLLHCMSSLRIYRICFGLVLQGRQIAVHRLTGAHDWHGHPAQARCCCSTDIGKRHVLCQSIFSVWGAMMGPSSTFYGRLAITRVIDLNSSCLLPTLEAFCLGTYICHPELEPVPHISHCQGAGVITSRAPTECGASGEANAFAST